MVSLPFCDHSLTLIRDSLRCGMRGVRFNYDVVPVTVREVISRKSLVGLQWRLSTVLTFLIQVFTWY